MSDNNTYLKELSTEELLRQIEKIKTDRQYHNDCFPNLVATTMLVEWADSKIRILERELIERGFETD